MCWQNRICRCSSMMMMKMRGGGSELHHNRGNSITCEHHTRYKRMRGAIVYLRSPRMRLQPTSMRRTTESNLQWRRHRASRSDTAMMLRSMLVCTRSREHLRSLVDSPLLLQMIARSKMNRQRQIETVVQRMDRLAVMTGDTLKR